MKKRNLTKKRKGLKFEILQNFRRRENKTEGVERFFLKKGKLKLKLAKTEKITHTTNKTGPRVHHLAKRSYHIYYNKRFSGSEKMRTVATNHIPVLVRALDSQGIGLDNIIQYV